MNVLKRRRLEKFKVRTRNKAVFPKWTFWKGVVSKNLKRGLETKLSFLNKRLEKVSSRKI